MLRIIWGGSFHLFLYRTGIDMEFREGYGLGRSGRHGRCMHTRERLEAVLGAYDHERDGMHSNLVTGVWLHRLE